MDSAVKIASLSVLMEIVSCSIGGLTYMDPLHLAPSSPYLRGEDPCKPLYWYPRQLPDYCYYPKPNISPQPMPMLLPMPVPPPAAVPPPAPAPPPAPPAVPLPQMPWPAMSLPPMPIFMPLPAPAPVPMPMPAMPLPFGAPMPMPPPYLPNLLPPPQMQSGFVPGIPGLVSPDGGLHILPFSDVYSDLLEKHKQKMVRRRLQDLLDEYDRRHKMRRSHRRPG